MDKKTKRGIYRRYSFIFQRGCKCERCGYTGNFGPLDFYVNGELVKAKEYQEAIEIIKKKIEGAELICQNCLHNDKDMEALLKTVYFFPMEEN